MLRWRLIELLSESTSGSFVRGLFWAEALLTLRSDPTEESMGEMPVLESLLLLEAAPSAGEFDEILDIGAVIETELS